MGGTVRQRTGDGEKGAPMDLRQLREYLVFAEELNYSLAAKRLFVSRPSLAAHLAELEDELNCQLIDKHGGHATLTGAGKQFVDTARRLVSDWEAVIETYRHLSDNLITVKVAASNLPWIAAHLFAARRALQRSHPEKQLSIVIENGPLSTIDALADDENRIVIAGYKQESSVCPLPSPSADGFVVSRERILLFVTDRSPLFARETICTADLAGATLMVPPDIYPGYQRDSMAERFATRGASVSIATQGFADHFEYFSHDFGQTVGIVPTTLLPRFGIDQRPDLRVFSLVDMDIASDFYALFNRSFIATENGRLLFEEMRRATEALAGM